jgi:hypothetical protein
MVSLFDFATLWLAIGVPLAIGYVVGKLFGLWPGIVSGVVLLAPCVFAAIRLHQAIRMKMKWKWLILLCIPVVLCGVLIWSISARKIPVDVFGDLSEKDVAEIKALARHEMLRGIMPDFSWRSLKRMPRAIKDYSSIKLFTLLTLPTIRSSNSVFVVLWSDTNGLSRSVFANELYDTNESIPHLQYELCLSNGFRFTFERMQGGWTYNWRNVVF